MGGPELQHSRYGAATRLLALLCLGLLPSAQVASFVHLAVVRHATCPEHGELIEAAHAPAAHAVAAEHAVAPVEDQGTDQHEHDHCLFASHVRQGAQARSPASFATHAALSAPAALAVEIRPASGPALLRVAPKQSPPAIS